MTGINGSEFAVLQGNMSADMTQTKSDIAKHRTHALELLRKNANLKEIKTGPLIHFASELNSSLQERYNRLGVSFSPPDTQIFIATDEYWKSVKMDPLTAGGRMDPDTNAIILPDFSHATDLSLPQTEKWILYNQMINLGHEMYHNVPTRYIAEKQGETNSFSRWRSGLLYFNGAKQSCLEEGMARTWEENVRKMAKNHFEDSFIISGSERYQDSMDMCKLLIKTIPNFEQLIEKARCEGQIEPLASAIDAKYGLNIFSKLTHTSDSEVHDLYMRIKYPKIHTPLR